ncbi:MAG: DUF2975 domain-containing protein, partial [Bacteroidaceae bacterium]|nr:DUF2975 domain-containing protein [Bacteroidaceae bacterium]
MKKKLNFLCITMLTLIVIEFARLCWEMKGFVKFFQHNMESIFADGSIDWVLFWVTIIAAALTLLILYLTLIRGLISFVKFMLNVNRDKIFVKDNVSLLRKTGKGIFLYNVFTLISILTGYFISVQFNQPQSLQLSWAYRSVIYPIILAFFCWVIAEVFAIGIKL